MINKKVNPRLLRIWDKISKHCESNGRTLLDEYRLILDKRSEMPSNQRAMLQITMEREILKAQEQHRAENN